MKMKFATNPQLDQRRAPSPGGTLPPLPEGEVYHVVPRDAWVRCEVVANALQFRAQRCGRELVDG